jgi:chromosome segregation ATPase
VTSAGGEERPEVAELLRVNAELAAELRALRAGRIEASRQGAVPAARGIAKLWGERRTLEGRLEETQKALEDTQAALEASRAEQEATQVAMEHVQAHREGLERQNQEMAAELVRLRAGLRGALRRARGRFLERTGLFGSR